jgi:hypothetical protein
MTSQMLSRDLNERKREVEAKSLAPVQRLFFFFEMPLWRALLT